MANDHNGGRWAILGFLYQILGMLSLTIQLMQKPSAQEIDEAENIDFFIGTQEMGEVISQHEKFDLNDAISLH